MKLTIPDVSLVVLIGANGSGKSSFARRHFKPSEVISLDYCQATVSDDEGDQDATKDAFDVLSFIVAKRLARGKLTVIDDSNVQFDARKPLVELARTYHCLPVAIVFNPPEHVSQLRNQMSHSGRVSHHTVHEQYQQLHRSLPKLKHEGFRHVFVLSSPEAVDLVEEVERQPLWCDRRDDYGPFDIIGDIHGCYDELCALLAKLGYQFKADADASDAPTMIPLPPGRRKAVFLGDLVDRGPKSVEVIRLVMAMVRAGVALCVPGNHDVKLKNYLRGRKMPVTHGLAESLASFEPESPTFRREVADFIASMASHYLLDEGRLAVAHAGMREEMQGRGSGRVRDFALYGETTGETDEYGLPVRYNWAADYRGSAMVVFGHTPNAEPVWLNNTLNVDSGCVFGGHLTALRYPEKELVSVPAARVYYQPVKPFLDLAAHSELSIQQEYDEVLDVADIAGKRVIETRLQGKLTIREENAIAALETISRFASNPKWLIYLPPTMSPCETSRLEGFLEHPNEAFAYYRRNGISEVICEQKHMGSRAIVIVCRDDDAATRRFGVTTDDFGICYTRTGRRFFDDAALERAFLLRLQIALTAADFWDRFDTDWVCLDCEIMPWSAKAEELVRLQYAAVGAAGRVGLAQAIAALNRAAANPGGNLAKPASFIPTNSSPNVADLLSRYQARAEMVDHYVHAYRRYCWPIHSLNDLKVAPFHLMATEGTVYIDKHHRWHMETLADLCHHDPALMFASSWQAVSVHDQASCQRGVDWWIDLTERGEEGMVVKPLDFVPPGPQAMVQPAIKCRGREYLRIIYGPEYTTPEYLDRLRSRALGAKRSLALREFALGLEGLERFIRREPLYRVHECAFGVLALESEPVDARL